MARRRNFWTAERLARLRVLWKTDKTQYQIAAMLGCNQVLVSYQAIKMKLPTRMRRSAQLRRLLSVDREKEFIGRYARGEDMAALIADYGLSRAQLKSLAWRHRDQVRMICAAEGLPIPPVRKKKPPPRNLSKPSADRPEQKKIQRCLQCGEDFMSEWFGNRICKKCKPKLARGSPAEKNRRWRA